ncbi:MAG: GNAT family N-acetyltransferase [Candidatus Cloacimonetes bacterium]|nr:GNAT family N-acetyltransferase [Candidatus Cloacimonadota bacterium]
MDYTIAPMIIADYDEIYQLWSDTEGVPLNVSDSIASIEKYLRRNQHTSFVAKDMRNRVIGAILCGHDGARGYIRHLAVSAPHRNNGIGGKLVEKSLATLKAESIHKCTVFILVDNEGGEIFWEKGGWHLRSELKAMSKII